MNRYHFVKVLHHEYVIIFKYGNILYIPKNERYITSFRKGKLLIWLENNHINYILIEELVIVLKKDYLDNRYKLYLKKGIIKNIIKRCGDEFYED